MAQKPSQAQTHKSKDKDEKEDNNEDNRMSHIAFAGPMKTMVQRDIIDWRFATDNMNKTTLYITNTKLAQFMDVEAPNEVGKNISIRGDDNYVVIKIVRMIDPSVKDE